MLAIPPCGASSNIALWRAKIKPPVELVVGDLGNTGKKVDIPPLRWYYLIHNIPSEIVGNKIKHENDGG